PSHQHVDLPVRALPVQGDRGPGRLRRPRLHGQPPEPERGRGRPARCRFPDRLPGAHPSVRRDALTFGRGSRPPGPFGPACYNPPPPRAATLPGHSVRGGSHLNQESAVVGVSRVIIIGGGLAGSEAAWQAGRRGLRVDLHEMRPVRTTPVHATSDLAELVCSNSLKSNLMDTASGLLKEEMRRCDSLIIKVADRVKVPAGGALAVDREQFARGVTEALEALPNVRVVREEARAIPEEGPCILATGPLASDAIAQAIAAFTGKDYLYFFDAISPSVEADRIDRGQLV